MAQKKKEKAGIEDNDRFLIREYTSCIYRLSDGTYMLEDSRWGCERLSIAEVVEYCIRDMIDSWHLADFKDYLVGVEDLLG